MPAIFQFLAIFIVSWVAGCVSCFALAPEPIPVAVVDVAYVDTSGEPADQSAAHATRARGFADDLRHDLAASGIYSVIAMTCGAGPCTAAANAADLQAAAHAARIERVIIIGVHKMSTLVQWGKVVIMDVPNGAVVFDRLVTFRGDTDEAWRKAESFVARDILDAAAPPAASASLIKIAVFDFELEDFSGGGSIIPESAEDAKNLHLATDIARKLIAQSGHYRLVEVEDAGAEPMRMHRLRDCGGCEASIALRLGADQSLIGIVTRITRTDYAETFKLRDARSGKLIDVEQTDLRIGANYSWDRGAAWLITNRLLDKHGTP